MADGDLKALMKLVRACTLCDALPLGPNPILQIDARVKVLIASQAPGRIAHEKDIAFLDPSGVRLRKWMGVDEDVFYNSGKIGILPMGFCFPGTGQGGDLAPRAICAPTWHAQLRAHMPDLLMTLVIGKHSMDYHFKTGPKMTLTQRVKTQAGCEGTRFAMPHPSPRNNRWLKANPWFESETVPRLQSRIAALL